MFHRITLLSFTHRFVRTEMDRLVSSDPEVKELYEMQVACDRALHQFRTAGNVLQNLLDKKAKNQP